MNACAGTTRFASAVMSVALVAATGTGTIKGRVIDGATGAPVAQARVRLHSYRPTTSVNEVLTDATGAFSLPGLSEGRYALAVEKAPYLRAWFPDSDRSLRAMPIVVEDDRSVEVTVPLQRGGTIAGRVVDEYGDPARNARVAALWVPRGGPLTIRASTQTNDRGEYRVANLTAGRYLIHVQPATQSGGPAEVGDRRLRLPVPTYYPSAHAIADAQPVTVNFGETVEGIVLRLTGGSAISVTGSVACRGGQRISSGNLRVRIAGTDAPNGIDLYTGTGIQQDGAFRVRLPAGEYFLEVWASPRSAESRPGRPGQLLFGSARVSLTAGPEASVNIIVGPNATASGRVVFDGWGAPSIPPTGVVRVPIITADGPGCQAATATVAADWTFKAEGLGGTCRAETLPFPGGSRLIPNGWMLKAVMFRGRNLVEDAVTFEPGQHYDDVRIVMTDRWPLVDLNVSGLDGQPTLDYVLIVFPLDREKWKRYPKSVHTFLPTAPRPTTTIGTRISAQVRPPGVFHGAPPGDYYVIAVDDISLEETWNPAILDRLATGATRVTLIEGAHSELALRRFTRADILR